MSARRTPLAGDAGTAVYTVAAAVALVCILASAAIIWELTAHRMAAVKPSAVRPDTDGRGAFVEAWSASVTPAVIHELAVVPGEPGEFFALNNDQIYRFDSTGTMRTKFAAPAKSSRIATDPTGAVPYLLVVSSKTKWTGAIDHTVTTDYFLHALDTRGQTVWEKRFDPAGLSALEPVAATVEGKPSIVLSAGRHIVCFDTSGRPMWDLALWHHPGTVAVADFKGDGNGQILAAQAPKRQIVRIDRHGRIAGVWGAGDGPSRLRTSHAQTTTLSAISLRQIFGPGLGVQHALTFFDGVGTAIREVELPVNATPLSYSPITAMDVDGSGGKVWVIALGDGSIRVYSPSGELLAQHEMGVRPRTYLAIPQPAGPDLLVAATNRGLTAWRPVAERIRERR